MIPYTIQPLKTQSFPKTPYNNPSNEISQSQRSNIFREDVGKSQGHGGVASLRTNKVIKGRRVRDTRSGILKIPQVTQSLQNGSSTVRLRLASNGVDTVVLNVALGSVGRDQPGGHTATETVEVESVGLSVGGSLSVGLVVGANSKRGLDVVEETTGLVEGQKEESLLPLRAGAEGVVHLLDQDLAERDVAGGVHRVGVGSAAGGVDVRELGQEAEVGVLVEVLEGNDVVLGVLGGPVVEQGVGQVGAVGAVVVEPRDTLGGSNLKDAGSVDSGDQEVVVVLTMAIGSTGEGTETVGVGRLFQC